MKKIILKIDGMACGMCEAHVNAAVRQAFQIKRVSSSFRKGETTILTNEPITEQALRETIEKTGYYVKSFTEQELNKKALFSR